MRTRLIVGILISSVFIPLFASAATYDVGFTGGSSDIFFSKPELQAGDPVRVYARVQNFGTNDVAAQVVFYQGDAIIDQPQVVSIRSGGVMDEVYVDWIVSQNSFNLRAEVKAQVPSDENKANDSAVTAFITPKSPPPPPPAPSGGSPAAVTGGLATSVGSGGGSVTPKTQLTGKTSTTAVRVANAETGKPAATPAPSPAAPTIGARETEGVMLAGLSPIIDPLTDDLLKVHIELSQKDWNTFDFHADVNRGGETSVTWSFGDGASNRGVDTRHSFSGAGRYVVSVVAVGPDGERAQEKVTLDISFWHLGNWQLWVIFLGLLGFVGVMTMLARRQQSKPLDDGSDSILEGVPMVEEQPVISAPKPAKRRVAKPKKKFVKKVEKKVEPPMLEPPSVE